MVVDTVHIRRENRLRMIIDRDCRIRPPQKGLRKRCAVIKLPSDLDISTIRIQRDRCNLLRSIDLVDISRQYGNTPIFVLTDPVVNRAEGRRTMMLRPVEFNPPADPRSAQAYQSRLDHMVVVDKIISVCLVICSLNASAQFWQNHHTNILVLKPDCSVCPLCLCAADFIDCRIWIYFPGTSLINTFLEEHRVPVRCSNLISWDDNRFFPGSNFFHDVRFLSAYI